MDPATWKVVLKKWGVGVPNLGRDRRALGQVVR
jgi:hypothetical protein